MKVIARNKRASHDYFLEEKFEAGIKLVGSEIKSIRLGKVSINEAFVTFKGAEAFITNMNISRYEQSSIFNHNETRPRKLLLNRREINRLMSRSNELGYSVVPVKLYIKDGLAKLEIALAKGKKNYDKREDLRRRDQDLRMRKALKGQ